MRTAWLLLLIFIFGLLTKGQQLDLSEKVKNDSPLRLQAKDSPKKITDVIGATYCFGDLDTCLNLLINIGVSKYRLTKFTQCTAGDFDGNGFLDFVIWGHDTTKIKDEGIDWPDYENYLVLFFKGTGVVRTELIKTEKGLPLVHYPPRLTKGPNGEPVSKTDALWTWGQTDDNDDYTKGTVYIFDDGRFTSISFGQHNAR
ncbi:MAG: hypothetical protein MUF75_13215 [Bacteroidia bacterium]|jgi:hypothetical protein|nr:hypothetical protein [Bacteroidia bacterium]